MVVISSPSPSGKRALVENRSGCDDDSQRLDPIESLPRLQTGSRFTTPTARRNLRVHAETRVTASMSVDTIQSLSRL